MCPLELMYQKQPLRLRCSEQLLNYWQQGQIPKNSKLCVILLNPVFLAKVSVSDFGKQ